MDITPANTSINKFLEDPYSGANCQLTTLGMMRLGGFENEEYLRSLEFYYDRKYTKPIPIYKGLHHEIEIPDLSNVKTGDIIGLCSTTQEDIRRVHLGTLLIENEIVKIAHNARHIGHMIIQPLREAQQYARHGRTAWVRRPTVKKQTSDHEIRIHPRLQTLAIRLNAA